MKESQRQLPYVLALFSLTILLGLGSAFLSTRDGSAAEPSPRVKVMVAAETPGRAAAGEPVRIPVSVSLDLSPASDDCSAQILQAHWSARSLQSEDRVRLYPQSHHALLIEAVFAEPGLHTVQVSCDCAYQTDCSDSGDQKVIRNVVVMAVPSNGG